MISYIAIMGKGESSISAVQSEVKKINDILPWYSVDYNKNNFVLLSAGNEDKLLKKYFLNNGAGMVFGTLFRKTDHEMGVPVPRNIDSAESIRISDSSGRWLVENYWGNYIAFICGLEDNEYVAVRDPSHTLPGTYYENDRYVIFFTDIEDIVKLGLKKFTFNKECIAALTKSPVTELPISTLNEMKKIVGGEALIVTSGKSEKQMLWHPRKFCEKRAYTDPSIAMRDLRNAVESSIHAWAAQFDGILLHLSGGLDSTITLHCLKTAPSKPRIVCLNYFSPSAGEDEREYAKSAASYYGVELIEKQNDGSSVDLTNILEFRLWPELAGCRGTSLNGGYHKRLADERGLDVLMTGEGGDAIFFSKSDGSIDDYIYHHGINRDVFSKIVSYGRMRDISLSSEIIDTIRNYISRPGYSIDSAMSQFPSLLMPTKLFEETKIDEVASWLLRPLEDLSHAKIDHILYSSFPYIARSPNRPEWYLPVVNPLFSQPLREVAYRIPAYMFSHRGISRGLIRMAFLDSAPKKNILRQFKGGVQTIFDDAIAKNWDFLRKFFKDSLMVELGIWDRDRIREALSSDLPPGAMFRLHLFDGAGYELWLKKMASSGWINH